MLIVINSLNGDGKFRLIPTGTYSELDKHTYILIYDHKDYNFQEVYLIL